MPLARFPSRAWGDSGLLQRQSGVVYEPTLTSALYIRARREKTFVRGARGGALSWSLKKKPTFWAAGCAEVENGDLPGKKKMAGLIRLLRQCRGGKKGARPAIQKNQAPRFLDENGLRKHQGSLVFCTGPNQRNSGRGGGEDVPSAKAFLIGGD